MKISKKQQIFLCEICDYKCCKNSDYIKHLSTLKHQKRTTCDIKVAEISKKIYKCNNCYKIYNSRNGLWCHSKICKNTEKKENLEYS